MNTTVRFLLTAIALLSMVNLAHADTDRDDEVMLEANEIDSSTVKVGALAVVVYEREEQNSLPRARARLDTAMGYIKAVDQRRLIVGLEPDGWSKWIALEHIQVLVLVGSPSPDAIARASALAAAAVDSDHAVDGSRETPERLSEKTKRRDVNGTGKRLAFKLVAGTLSGIGVSFGGFVLMSGVDDSGWTPLIFSVLIGYPVGSAIGVSLVDPHDHFRHSLIGGLLGVGLAAPAASDINFLVLPPICAALASELFRKPPEARRISVGLVPDPKGLSAIATLRF